MIPHLLALGGPIVSGLIDPQAVITAAGAWALPVVAAMVFAETALLVGFFLPGDTLLFFVGVLVLSGAIPQPLWLVIGVIAVAAILGDQVGYQIGRAAGPRIFQGRGSGLLSTDMVTRTERFFIRFGPASVVLARFIAVVRTIAPVAAGVSRMPRTRFTIFNIIGGVLWSTAVVLVGFGFAHVPGVTQFVANYLDLILIGIAVHTVAVILIRVIFVRRRRTRADPARFPTDPPVSSDPIQPTTADRG